MIHLPAADRKAVYTWTRNLHLFAGLFLSPFLLLFAISTLALNHPTGAPGNATVEAVRSRKIVNDRAAGIGSLAHARDILRQLDLTGEIDNIRHNAKAGRLVIPVSKPGELTTVSVDLASGVATVQRQAEGVTAALIYLHKRPGPHLVKLRGNWSYMKIWSSVADSVVYGTLFLTISGLYLWWLFKAERGIGLALLAAGLLSVGGLATAILTA